MSIVFENEKDVFAGPFFLVSYSHRDADIVRKDVEALMDKGARLWIDHRSDEVGNMFYGDNWKEKITNALGRENCIGALIYISPYSLAGRATQWEQEQIFSNTKLKKYFVSVNTEGREGGTSVKRHYKLASRLCDEDDSDDRIFVNVDYDDEIRPKQEIWINPKNEELYINRLSSEMCVNELLKIALQDGIISSTEKDRTKIENTSSKKSNAGKIQLGVCKDREMPGVTADNNLKDYRFVRSRDGYSNIKDNYISLNQKVYLAKPLSWQLLYTKPEDDTKVFIACEVVDSWQGNRLDEFLEKFKSVAFTPEESEMIGCLRIPDESDLLKSDIPNIENALKLPAEQSLMSWWIDDQGLFPEWKRLYKDNKPYGHGFLVTLKKGVRPILELSSKSFARILEMGDK